MKPLNDHVVCCEIKRLTAMTEQSKSEQEFNFWRNKLATYLSDVAESVSSKTYNNDNNMEERR